MLATVSALKVVAWSCTKSNAGSLAVTVLPSVRNVAVGSVVRRPIWTTFAGIGTRVQPALKATAAFRALSMIGKLHSVGTTAEAPDVDRDRICCAKLA